MFTLISGHHKLEGRIHIIKPSTPLYPPRNLDDVTEAGDHYGLFDVLKKSNGFLALHHIEK